MGARLIFQFAGTADDDHGIVFTDIRGRTLGGRGRPDRPDTDPDPPEPGFRPPSGERMNYRYFTGWVSDRELQRRRTAARSRRSTNPDP